MTLAQTAQKALEHRAEVGRGANPQHTRHTGMTFKTLAEQCLAEHPSLSVMSVCLGNKASLCSNRLT